MGDWYDEFLEELNRTTSINRKLLAQKEQEQIRAAHIAAALAAKQQKEESERRSLQASMSKKLMAASITAIILMAVIFVLTIVVVYATMVNPILYIGIIMGILAEFYLISKVVEYMNKGRFIQ